MKDRKDYLSIFDSDENFLNEFLRIGKRVVKIAKKKYPLQYEDFINTLVMCTKFVEDEDLYFISKNTNQFCHELFDSLENIDYKSKNELDLFTTKWRQKLQIRNDNGVEINDHIEQLVNYTISKNDLELEKFFLDSKETLRIGRTLKENLLPFCKGNMFSEKLTDRLLTFVNFNPLFCGFIYYELSLEMTKNCVTPIFERYKRIYKKDIGITPCRNEFLNFIQNNCPVHSLDSGSIKHILSEYMDYEVNSHYSLPKNRKYKKQIIDITPHQTLSIEATSATEEDGKKEMTFNDLFPSDEDKEMVMKMLVGLKIINSEGKYLLGSKRGIIRVFIDVMKEEGYFVDIDRKPILRVFTPVVIGKTVETIKEPSDFDFEVKKRQIIKKLIELKK